MRLCNQYQTAFKEVSDPASIQHLLDAGWREYVEEPKQEIAQETDVAAAPPPPSSPNMPKTNYRRKTALTYKGRYLSSIAQMGTVKELRDVLRYVGIDTKGANKADMQQLLREHIRVIKETEKEERALAGK